MHRLRTHLPSANHLFAFEAAARRGSFTAAATELNISQPAVSKTIRQLEDGLGFRLFHRQHNRLELTAEGKRLFREIEKAFDTLDTTIMAMRQGHRGQTVRAAFSAAFLQLWLLPRLAEFHDRHPDVRLSLEESAYDDLNLFADGIEVSSRLGDGDWPDLHARPLVPEVILPVVHPGYVARVGGSIAPANLPRERLLHFRERHRVRHGWRDWLHAQGIAAPVIDETVVFADALGSLGAAALGHGIALGWAHLVLDQVRGGQLQPVGTARLRTGAAIHLVWSRKRPLSAAGDTFIGWMQRRMAEDMAANPGLF